MRRRIAARRGFVKPSVRIALRKARTVNAASLPVSGVDAGADRLSLDLRAAGGFNLLSVFAAEQSR
jgi:hypothetical protein